MKKTLSNWSLNAPFLKRSQTTYSLVGLPSNARTWPEKPAKDCVSVVIPVLDESKMVANVIKFAWKSQLVAEVIVVDDGSIDGTPELARDAGARVITSFMLGKGASLEDGLLQAKCDVILYLDGDLSGLANDLIEKMCEPILSGSADFVKASFSRKAGRVTALTARPLLQTYFPEVADFQQPLGGIVGARKELLKKLRFENDYGVDVGLLLDSIALGARVIEVDIGHIEHDSKQLEMLGEMATQVARAILDRAAWYGRLSRSFARESKSREQSVRAHPESVLSRVGAVNRLALFDMDGTLLDGRFIVALGARTGREKRLAKYLDRLDITPEYRTRKIASVFRGLPIEVFEQTAREMPLVTGAAEAVIGLRKLGYCVGIVTDSYHVAAEIVRRRVFADFALANVVEFRKGRSTGILTLAPTMRSGLTGRRAYDKLNALRFLTKRMGITAKQVVAIGDGINDIGMLRAAGVSIAFQPKTEQVKRAAKHVVNHRLDQILDFI